MMLSNAQFRSISDDRRSHRRDDCDLLYPSASRENRLFSGAFFNNIGQTRTLTTLKRLPESGRSSLAVGYGKP